MKTLQLLLIATSVLLLPACSTQPLSEVHRIGNSEYLVQTSYSFSEGDDTGAGIILDSIASEACQGDYTKTKQWLFPDPYWDEVILYWKVECGANFPQLSQNTTRVL